jgi:hypothetical protein
MALALESAGKVRQKARIYTQEPLVAASLKAFFVWWAQNKGNADLQLVPYAGTDAEAANGANAGLAAVCTIYAVYGKKTRTAEDVFLSVLDDAGGAEGTTFLMSLGFFGTNGTSTTLPQDEQVVVSTVGWPVAAGVNVKAYTTVAGTSDTTAGAAPNGFYIVGA